VVAGVFAGGALAGVFAAGVEMTDAVGVTRVKEPAVEMHWAPFGSLWAGLQA